MDKDLVYEVLGPTALLTLNREEKRNALTQEMISDFLGYLDRVDEDNDVRAVCLTGAGEKAFCAGADLTGNFKGKDRENLSGAERYATLLKRLSKFSKPLVARVNGPCLAGGIGLMLSCDIVIARSDVFFSTPEVNVGIFPMMVGALLLQNVTRKKAMEMVLTGRRVSAPEAENMGLITRAVEPDRLDEEVQKTLTSLISNSPAGMGMGKEAFRAMEGLPFDEAVDYLSRALVKVAATEDAREGMTAFLEKRSPGFQGEIAFIRNSLPGEKTFMTTSEKKDDKEIFAFLSQTPVFASLPEEELRRLCDDMTKEQYGEGFILCEQEKTSLEKVYIIESGSLELYFDEEGKKRMRGTLGRGDVFGGIAILMNSGKSVRTVVVKEDVVLYVISKENFIDICTRYQPFYTFFVETFHGRLVDKSYASIFQVSQIGNFLSDIVPFTLLPEDVLKEISKAFSIVIIPAAPDSFTRASRRSSTCISSKKARLNDITRKGKKRYCEGSWERGICMAAFPC